MTKLFKHFATLVLVCGIFLIASCGKDSTDGGDTTVELMVRAPWKFSKATASGVDVSALVTACIKDNLLTFSSSNAGSNTGKLNEGATKCNAPDPQEVDFTWVYDASFKKITITGTSGNVPILPGGSNEFTLVRVTEIELVMSQNVSFSGTTQLVEVTMVH
jgi:hypothetical protein